MAQSIELGLDTFGDVTVGADGRRLAQAEVLRHVVEEAVLADQLGLAFFGVGEHHRKDFSISAPEVVLAAIAARTTQIHLGSSVTVLSTDDPVRVFERFSTLNAISNGRAEVIVGRGSFTESFPLFGFDMAHYEDLFEEKLQLWAELREGAAGDVGRPAALAAVESGCVSTERDGHAAHVGRGGRQPGVGRTRRAVRLPVDAGDHRRQPAAIQRVRRPL